MEVYITMYPHFVNVDTFPGNLAMSIAMYTAMQSQNAESAYFKSRPGLSPEKNRAGVSALSVL